MEQIINEFTRALIPVVVAFIAALLGLVLNQARVWLTRKAGVEETQLINDLLLQAVKAAEQSLATESGVQRKAYALQHAQSALDRLGLKVDVILLQSWIESAVSDMNNDVK